jgi:hypothetical protein
MEIRPFRQGDEEAILALDARVLPSAWNPRTLENWHWKFTDKNPTGKAFIWIAEYEDQMIAHFAAVPYRLKVFDREVVASHSIGALVEKKYQNRGLLKLVGDKLWEELSREDIALTWGFPNRRAYAFHKIILGYSDLIDFHTWRIMKSDMPACEPQPSLTEIKEFDAEFDALWKRCSGGYGIAVVRNRSYLNWRYLQRPDWSYVPFGCYESDGLKGYVVLKLFEEEGITRGHIVDIFGYPDDRQTFLRLINGSLNYFSDQAVDEVTVWIWGNSAIESLLMEKGFTKMAAYRPLVLRINGTEANEKKVRDNFHWYFTMGDSTEIF